MTRQQTVAEYLLLNGCTEIVPSKSYKYRQFETPKGNTYWLGRQGAVRKGRAVSKSISLTGFIQFKKIARIVANVS